MEVICQTIYPTSVTTALNEQRLTDPKDHDQFPEDLHVVKVTEYLVRYYVVRGANDAEQAEDYVQEGLYGIEAFLEPLDSDAYIDSELRTFEAQEFITLRRIS